MKYKRICPIGMDLSLLFIMVKWVYTENIFIQIVQFIYNIFWIGLQIHKKIRVTMIVIKHAY